MKFLFEKSFDADERTGAPPPPPPVRQYTEEDLLAARAEGHAEGMAAGRAAALASIEQASQTALAEIASSLRDMGGQIEAIRAQTIAEAVTVLGAAIQKIVPDLARRNTLGEIERLIRECLQAIYDEPRVVVRAHDSVIAALHERIDALAIACGFNGKVVLFGDDQLGEADCRIEWADGGAERSVAALWQQIDAALARVLDPSGAVAPGPDAVRAEPLKA